MHAQANMAMDQALLENSNRLGQPLIRFYSWIGDPATFGYFQKYTDVASMTSLRPLVRRPTGGGLVKHSSDWTYSVIIPKAHEWWGIAAEASYERIHEWCKQSLIEIGIAADLAPQKDPSGPGNCFIGAEKDDLILNGSKIGGAAQRRNKEGLLIQGSIQSPVNQDLKSDWIKAMLSQKNYIFEEWSGWKSESLSQRVNELASTRYSSEDYNMKR